MPRKYSTMTPKELREEECIGLMEAKKKIVISQMLDRLEKPMSHSFAVREMNDVLIEFIKLQTGVK